MPDDLSHTDELESLANTLISEADVNKQVLPTAPRGLIEYSFLFFPQKEYSNLSPPDHYQLLQVTNSLLSALSLAGCWRKTS